MGDRLQEIRALWNREDLDQPVSIGAAFDAVEWCLGEIGRLQELYEVASKSDAEIRTAWKGAYSQLEAMTRLKESFEDQVARIARERDDAHAERDTTLKREGRLRGALMEISVGLPPGTALSANLASQMWQDCVTAATEALADEGRE